MFSKKLFVFGIVLLLLLHLLYLDHLSIQKKNTDNLRYVKLLNETLTEIGFERHQLLRAGHNYYKGSSGVEIDSIKHPIVNKSPSLTGLPVSNSHHVDIAMDMPAVKASNQSWFSRHWNRGHIQPVPSSTTDTEKTSILVESSTSLAGKSVAIFTMDSISSYESNSHKGGASGNYI